MKRKIFCKTDQIFKKQKKKNLKCAPNDSTRIGKWWKNTAGLWHRRLGGHALADEVTVCWIWISNWLRCIQILNSRYVPSIPTRAKSYPQPPLRHKHDVKQYRCDVTVLLCESSLCNFWTWPANTLALSIADMSYYFPFCICKLSLELRGTR